MRVTFHCDNPHMHAYMHVGATLPDDQSDVDALLTTYLI